MELRNTFVSIAHNVAKPKKDGTNYMVTQVTYIRADNISETKDINATWMSKQPVLLAQIAALVPGTAYIMQYKLNGTYTNLIGILPDDGRAVEAPPAIQAQAASGSGGGHRKGGSDSAIGQQIGNALTNAATLLGTGKTADELMAMAEDIIKVGEILKQRHAAGAYAPAIPAAPAPATIPVAPAVPAIAPATIAPVIPAISNQAAPAPAIVQTPAGPVNTATGEVIVGNTQAFNQLIGN